MKLLKKLFVITLAIGMVMGMGAVSAYADTTESSSEDSTVREVVFYEDFEGDDMVVGTRPEKVGGVSQTWGSVDFNGEPQYKAEIVQDSDNNTKALQLGNHGNAAMSALTEFISFGDTYSEGKYEFSYKVRCLEDKAYAKYFMCLADADKANATWESIAASSFWIGHNGINGAPSSYFANPSGGSFSSMGFSGQNSAGAWALKNNYVNIKIVADFDKGTYMTYVPFGNNGTSLNKKSVSGLLCQFVYGAHVGSYGSGSTCTYYIDEIKVTKIYDLIGDLPIKDGAVYNESLTLPEIKPADDSVTYSVAYYKDGKQLFEELDSGVLGIGDYTLKVTAQKTDKEGNTVTASKEVSFKVVPVVSYTDDEYEIVFSENFDNMETGVTPSTIGGASQSLSDKAKIVSDSNGNKALSIGTTASNQNFSEFISFGDTYNSGKYDFTYKLRCLANKAYSTHFMSLADSSKGRATWECLAVGYFWVSHNGLIGGAPENAQGISFSKVGLNDAEKYVNAKMVVDFNNKKYKTYLGSEGGREYSLNKNSVAGFRSDFSDNSAYYGSIGDTAGIATYYIDDISIKEYYGLAVGLPFKTGEKYAEGIKAPEITLADGVTLKSAVYAKDGETLDVAVGDNLEAGEYTLKVVATDGYNEETRLVKFTVTEKGLKVSKAYMQDENGDTVSSFENSDKIKAFVELSVAEGFGDYSVIAVLRNKADDSVKNIFVKSKAEITDDKASFDFDIPAEGEYTLEYFVWENVGSLKAITPKGTFGESQSTH